MPKSKTPQSVATYLQAAMEAQRRSQAQFAKMSGVAQSYLGRGQPRAPADPQLERLTTAYGKCSQRNKRLVVQLAEGLAQASKKK